MTTNRDKQDVAQADKTEVASSLLDDYARALDRLTLAAEQWASAEKYHPTKLALEELQAAALEFARAAR